LPKWGTTRLADVSHASIRECVAEVAETHSASTAVKAHISLVPYSPLGRGALTGAITSRDDLPPNDWRRTVPQYAEDTFDRNLATLQVIREIAEAHDATPGQVSLAWLLAKAPDVVPIPGTRRIAYLEQFAIGNHRTQRCRTRAARRRDRRRRPRRLLCRELDLRREPSARSA